MSARARILERIGAARGREPPARPSGRATAGGVDGELLAHFKSRAQRLANDVASAATDAEVPAVAAHYLSAQQLPLRAVCWPQVAALPWREAGIDIEVRPAAAADATGVTGVFAAIAETGTLVLLSGAHTPATVSLLPETHIAIVRRDQVVATMEQAWAKMRAETRGIPRAINFVSGPSRTADVEQTVTLGAHGPRRVLVVTVG